MNLVTINFRNPAGNILGGIAIHQIPGPRMILDCLTLMRAGANIYSMAGRSSIDRIEAKIIQKITKVCDYIASYYAKKKEPIAPERPSFDPVACEEPIVKDAFYTKNMCTAHQVSSEEVYRYIRQLAFNSIDRDAIAPPELFERMDKERELYNARGKKDFSGPGVFAKLENSNRCTLDGHEEQAVVMCNQHGHTNSTMPRPGPDVVGEVFSKLDKCTDEFLKLL